MRTALIVSVLILAAGPAFAAGGGGHSSSSGKSNRFQASWSLAVPEYSTTGETVVVAPDHRDAGHGAESSGHGEEASGAAPEPVDSANPRMVEMPILVAPFVVGGELVNYAFVGVTIDVAEGNDPWKVRDKTAYLRDAMLRAAHEEPVNVDGDPVRLDAQRASRIWTAAARRVLGEGVVSGVHVVSADVRYPDLAGGR